MEPKWAVIAGLLVAGGLLIVVDKALGRRLPVAELERRQATSRRWGGRLGVMATALLAVVTAVAAAIAWREGNGSGSIFLVLIAVVCAVGAYLSFKAGDGQASS